MANHQRIGVQSNAHAGKAFEVDAREYFATMENISLVPNYSVPLGVTLSKKLHRFDLGNDDVLVECKSHTWTETGQIPSAKMTTWNQAMFYFLIAPKRYRKVMFVLTARHNSRSETLAEYYCRIYHHLIPPDVSIVEFDPTAKLSRYVRSASSANRFVEV